MSSSIFPSIKVKIGNAFKGKLYTGLLTRDSDPIWVDNVLTDGTPQSFRVEGFPDQYSEMYRAQAGIPQGDSKITLIAANCQTTPKKDDKITFTGFGTFVVREVKTDPATAAYECQVYKDKTA